MNPRQKPAPKRTREPPEFDLDAVMRAMYAGWVAWERRAMPAFDPPFEAMDSYNLDRYRAAGQAVLALYERCRKAERQAGREA